MPRRSNTVVRRLAPKRPGRVEHELCPECACCTLAEDPVPALKTHLFDSRSGEWTCYCSNGPHGPYGPLVRVYVPDDEDEDWDTDGLDYEREHDLDDEEDDW